MKTVEEMAAEIISTESKCIEWGASADRSVKIAAATITAYIRQQVYERSISAAKEIVAAFDIEMPRGRNYSNGIAQTIQIIIEQNMLGNVRN